MYKLYKREPLLIIYMNFPPLPSISLNISEMEIANLKLDNITLDKIGIDLPIHSIYIVFISMFVCLIIQVLATLKIMIEFRERSITQDKSYLSHD